MLHIRFVYCLIASFALLMGCSKKETNGGSARLSFTLPQSFQKGNLSFNDSACYAVNITGPDIETVSPGSCDASYGTFAGLRPLGTTIELEASYGVDRVIEIYYVISSNGCLGFDPSNGLGATFGGNKVFRIGQVSGIAFDQPEVVVDIPVSYANVNNNLRSLLNLPASCDNGTDPIFNVNRNLVRVINGKMKDVSSGGTKVEIRLLDKSLPVGGLPSIEPTLPLGESQ